MMYCVWLRIKIKAQDLERFSRLYTAVIGSDIASHITIPATVNAENLSFLAINSHSYFVRQFFNSLELHFRFNCEHSHLFFIRCYM